MPSCATETRWIFALSLASLAGCAQSAPPAATGGSAAPQAGVSAAGAAATPLGGGAGSSTEDTSPPDMPMAGSYANDPRKQIFERESYGREACSNTSIRQLIDTIHAQQPELTDIVVLAGADPHGDGNLISAYLINDGSFQLVFQRGMGDCLAGCIDHEYWYFQTDGQCAPKQVGHYKRTSSGSCFEEDGAPMWNLPNPLDPTLSCGSSNDAAAISGSYEFRAKGTLNPCLRSGETGQARGIDATITIDIVQDAAQPARGTVTLHGVGSKLIDERVLPADFQRRRFTVHAEQSNLPSRCPQQNTLDVSYDFEGFGSHELQLMELDTPDCKKPDDYCKGFSKLDLSEVK